MKDNVRTNVLLETGEFKLDAVRTDRDLDEVVIPVGIGLHLATYTRRLVHERDFDFVEHGSRGIGDTAYNAAARTLSESEACEQQANKRNQAAIRPRGSRRVHGSSGFFGWSFQF